MDPTLEKRNQQHSSSSTVQAEASFPIRHANSTRRLLKNLTKQYQRATSDQELGAALRDTLSKHGVNEVITFFESTIQPADTDIVGVSTISFYAIALVLSGHVSNAVAVVSESLSERDFMDADYVPASICLSAAHDQFDNARAALALMRENALEEEDGKKRRFAATLCALFLESRVPGIGVELIQALDVEELNGLKARFERAGHDSDGANRADLIKTIENELSTRQESPLESLLELENRVFDQKHYRNWLQLAVILSEGYNSQATIDLLTDRAKYLINDGCEQGFVVEFIDRCIKNYGHNVDLKKTFGDLIDTALTAGRPEVAVDIALTFQSRSDQKFADYIRGVLGEAEVPPAFLGLLDSLALLVPSTKFRTAVSEYYFKGGNNEKALSFWQNIRQLDRPARDSLLSIAPPKVANRLRRSSRRNATKLDSSLSNLSDLLDSDQQKEVWKQLAPSVGILEDGKARTLPHPTYYRILHSYARFAGLTLKPEHFERLNRLVKQLKEEELISVNQAKALHITAGSMKQTTSAARAMDNDRRLMAEKGRSIIFVPGSKHHFISRR
jgi:hypothetical protein